MRSEGPEESNDPRVGLCSRCAQVRRQESARGETFYRCARADTDDRFLRYPPLPVQACPGFEPNPAPASD